MSRWTTTFTRALSGLVAAAFILGTPLLASPSPAAAQGYERVAASCGNCSGSVSVNARIGDTCPHCGVMWGAERNSYTEATSRRRRRSPRRARAKRAAAPRAERPMVAVINGKRVPAVRHQGKLCVAARQATAAAGARLTGSPRTGRFRLKTPGGASIPCVTGSGQPGAEAIRGYLIGGKTYVGLRELCTRLRLDLAFDHNRNRYRAYTRETSMRK